MFFFGRNCIPDVYQRATPPSQSGPNISHIPLYPDVNEVFEDDQALLQFEPCSPPKPSAMRRSRKSSEKKKGKRKELGVMISDLLTIDDVGNSTFESVLAPEPFQETKQESLTSHKLSTYLSDMLKRQPRNLKLSRITEAEMQHSPKTPTNSFITAKNESEKEHKVNPVINGSPASPTPIKTVPRKSSANALPEKRVYQNHFPELGAPVSSPSQKSEDISHQDKVISPTAPSSRAPRKKLSQKQRKRMEEERRKNESLQATSECTQVVSNAWGIPTR